MISTKHLSPSAPVLIESMRDIGYSLATAIADIIDNSITADAEIIELLADTISASPAIGIIDNGKGMSSTELHHAMRFGSKSPLERRTPNDLGRFGLGLKTASLSQCRRLTVVTRKNGATSCAIWDLDIVAQTGEWLIHVETNYDSIPWSEKLGTHGTLVVWENLDRLLTYSDKSQSNMKRQVTDAVSHVELVFHRFISAKSVAPRRLKILFNGRELQPFDPFNLNHPATQIHPEEIFRLKECNIRILPVTLPHHNKASIEEWNRYGGREGYLKNQGFYVYRNNRLIVKGTWFGLARQSELTKLSRVQIDVPNRLDAEWRIDVMKAHAHPPPPVRARLKRLIDSIASPSKRIFEKRGTRLTEDNRLPVWLRTQKGTDISYELNTEHPAVQSFLKNLNTTNSEQFRTLLALFASTLPVDAFLTDLADSPKNLSLFSLPDERMIELAKTTFLSLQQNGFSPEDVELMMRSAEPFKSNWSNIEQHLRSVSDVRIEND